MAADGLTLPTPGNEVLRRRLTVSVLPNTQVIVLHYAGSDPQVALETARRIARATLAERVARAAAANAQRAEIVNARIDAIKAEVADQAGELADDPTERRAQAADQAAEPGERRPRGPAAGRRRHAVTSPGEIIASSTHNDVMLKRLRLARRWSAASAPGCSWAPGSVARRGVGTRPRSAARPRRDEGPGHVVPALRHAVRRACVVGQSVQATEEFRLFLKAASLLDDS